MERADATHLPRCLLASSEFCFAKLRGSDEILKGHYIEVDAVTRFCGLSELVADAGPAGPGAASESPPCSIHPRLPSQSAPRDDDHRRARWPQAARTAARRPRRAARGAARPPPPAPATQARANLPGHPPPARAGSAPHGHSGARARGRTGQKTPRPLPLRRSSRQRRWQRLRQRRLLQRQRQRQRQQRRRGRSICLGPLRPRSRR